MCEVLAHHHRYSAAVPPAWLGHSVQQLKLAVFAAGKPVRDRIYVVLATPSSWLGTGMEVCKNRGGISVDLLFVTPSP